MRTEWKVPTISDERASFILDTVIDNNMANARRGTETNRILDSLCLTEEETDALGLEWLMCLYEEPNPSTL